MSENQHVDPAPWITFRPEIKVLDCTIRDGGLVCDHQFDDVIVRGVYETCVAAGIDYMEIGYKNSDKIFARDEYGAWKFCDEDDIRRIVGENDSDLKLTAMADVDKSDYDTQILPVEHSPLDCIRVATYVHQISSAIEMIKDAHDKGYETTCNIMAISTVADAEIDQALEELAESPVDTIVVVDSYGALYHEQIRNLVRKYRAIAEPVGKEVGIHTHNNAQLAFANTIEAIAQGANRVDATMAGLGRGAGNCPMELLIGFLRNPKFHLRPILKLLEEQFVPLEKQYDWGFSVPYAITGMLNQHPRTAIRARAEEPDAYTKFYNACVSDI